MDMRAYGGIQSSMDERDGCQNVECILFANVPVNLWSMRGRVPERTEETLDPVHSTIVFVTLAV
jgi:hypothetical protein